jgi:hypothetical protein
MTILGGFGHLYGGLWGGAVEGELLPDYFDLYCFQHCDTMLAILLDPMVSTAGDGSQFEIDGPTCDLIIRSGVDGGTIDDARLQVTNSVPADWTLQWNVLFTELPTDFSDYVNKHVFVGATDASGPCAGLFIAKSGLMYVGAVHHDALGTLILDSTTQTIPASHEYIELGVYLTFRLAVSGQTGSVYLYVTRADDLPVTGHQLRAVLPVVDHQALAYPPSDRTLVSVRGTVPQPSRIYLDQLCMSSAVVIPNLRPVADAGRDIAARTCGVVQLDGRAAYDPEGALLAYLWKLVDAPAGSEVAVELYDGHTDADPSDYVDKFYSDNLGVVHTADPVMAGDVLTVGNNSYVVASTGVDGGGFYLFFASAFVPASLSIAPFKLIRQRYVEGRDTAQPTFYPDRPGFYRFILQVTDGSLGSEDSSVIVNVLESPLPRGYTPDLSFMFSYLSDAWRLVEDREVLATLWSGLAQVAASELFTLWQVDYNKSLRDVQRTFLRRWLHYDLLLAEPLPELTTIRVIWGGLTGGPMDSAGVSGVSGTELVVTSELLSRPVTVTFPNPDPWTASQMQMRVEATLRQADDRFTVNVFVDLAGDEYFTINAPFPFSVDETTTLPAPVITLGQNAHPHGTGAGVGIRVYKTDRCLQGVDILEDDLLCLDGLAYRVIGMVNEPTDEFPYQRLLVKNDLPSSPSTSWALGSRAKSELLDFYNGLVAKDDHVYFEVFDQQTDISSVERRHDLVATQVLGVCAQLPGELAFVPEPVGADAAQTSLVVRLAKVVRRSHVPVSQLVVDIPTLTERLVINTVADEKAVLRRNVDFFIEEFRGRQSIRFVASLTGTDVWENLEPPNRLWAEYTYLDNRPTIEGNFGVPAGFTLDNLSELASDVDYLSAVRGLYYAYLNGPTLYHIRVGTQILLGLPFAEEAGTIEEVRTDFSPNQGRLLVRDRDRQSIVRSYDFPSSLELEVNPTTGVRYQVGDQVAQFSPLVEGVEVGDYVSNPTWFAGLLQQGNFFEVEKFFRFLVRVDSEAFGLAALMFASQFVHRIKPTYTRPLFLVTKQVESEVSVTDQTQLNGTLKLTDAISSAWLGAAPTYDDPRAAGGGWRNKFDKDLNPDVADPTYPTPDASVGWAFDKMYRVPVDVVEGRELVTLAVPTVVGAEFTGTVEVWHTWQDIGTFSVPAGPTGLALTADSPMVVPFTGTLTAVRLLVCGGPGSDPATYELVLSVNGVDQTPIAFTSVASGTDLLTTGLVIGLTAGDTLGARVRPVSGGPYAPAWRFVRVDVLAGTASWSGTMPAGRYAQGGTL